MLKVKRATLSKTPKDDLALRQSAVDAGNGGEDPWKDFNDHERDAPAADTVRHALKEMFAGKCGYCESDNASQIDHFWPKSSHKSLNKGRGTSAKMFLWKNLIWSCEACNSRGCKGTHMSWDQSGRTLLLNPCVKGDDPFCYFTISTEETAGVLLGWMDPSPGLAKWALRRAEYTRKRLKLNLRDGLRHGRARAIKRFLDFVGLFDVSGQDPDFAARPGRTFRVIFREILAPHEPHLAAIRQLLRKDLALRGRLIAAMPELGLLLDRWDLPPDDCAALRAAP